MLPRLSVQRAFTSLDAKELNSLSARAVNVLGRHGIRTREQAHQANVLALLAGERNCGIWQDVVGGQAGKKYKISLYVMADKVEGARLPPNTLELRLEHADNGQQSLLESKMIPMITLPTDGKWQEVSIEGTTPSDSLRFLMVMTPLDGENRGGKFKFDDVKVELMP